jgi:hypothetical protein
VKEVAMSLMLALAAAVGVSVFDSKRPRPRRYRRRSDSEGTVPSDLLRRVAQGGRAVDHRMVIRFGLQDANEPEETRRKIA